MRRRAFLLGLALAAWSSASLSAAPRRRFEQGLLWQIGRPGVAPSWLFGTLHQPDPRLLPLPAPVAAAFARCRRLVIELLPHEAGAARFSAATRADSGERARRGEGLEHALPAVVFQALVSKLEAVGVARELVAELKPWAALLLLTSLPPGEGAEAANSLDNELFIRARLAGMRVEELDSVEEQIAVFDDIPFAAQLALLTAALDFHDLLPGFADETVEAYLARDLGRLHRLGRILEDRRPELAGPQRVLEKKVIVDRSVVMAYRLQPFLRRGRAFVAVGASHLYGDQGLPALLRQEYGWRLRPAW